MIDARIIWRVGFRIAKGGVGVEGRASETC